MRILVALIAFAALTVSCSSGSIPQDVKDLKGKPYGGVDLETKYCKFETTSSSNNFYTYMYFPCKDFTIALNKRTGVVEGVYAGRK